VIQSYSAYTPELARRNAAHLLSGDAPELVLFKVEAIDGRLPALEDGVSWLPLLTRYLPGSFSEDSGYLALNASGGNGQSIPDGPVTRLSGDFGSTVAIPESEAGWLAQFDISMTPLGRLRNLLWSPPRVRIKVTLETGEVQVFRFIPSMAREPFVLSPLVTDTEDFLGLATQGERGTSPQPVSLVEIDTDSSGWWTTHYEMRLQPLDLNPPPRPGE
jgi:hypothetical protein